MDGAEPRQNHIRDAFEAFYDRSFDTVYGYVYARVGNAVMAEEIVQETYIAAWGSLDRFESRSQGTTWAIGIARHKIADYYRREARRGLHEDTPAQWETLASDADLETVILGNETKAHVAKAIESLNPLYRYVLAMKYLDGYSLREIARILHRTPKAIDGILQRAKAGFIRRYRELSKEGNSRG